MEFRKLVGFGKGSFIISLPKQWVDKNKLKKGDLIGVEENNDGLILSLGNVEERKEDSMITIEAESKTLEQIKTEIISAYLNNYDVIGVISKNLNERAQDIKAVLNDLSGFEIINQSNTKIIAKDLINIKEIPIETLIRRMDNITRAMIIDAMECFDRCGDPESIIHRDEDINRLHFLAFRIIRSALRNVRLAKALQTNPLKLYTENIVTTNIERIADNVKRICRALSESKLDKKWMVELKRIFKKIKDSYTDVMKAYYTKNKDLALSLEQKNKGLVDECIELFENHEHEEIKHGKKIKGKCEFRNACNSTTQIIENMKEMISNIRYLARAVISSD